MTHADIINSTKDSTANLAYLNYKLLFQKLHFAWVKLRTLTHKFATGNKSFLP